MTGFPIVDFSLLMLATSPLGVAIYGSLLMASEVQPNDLVSLAALGAFFKVLIVAAGGVGVAIIGKVWGARSERAKSVTIEGGEREVPVRQRKINGPPSWDQHTALIERVVAVERDVRQLRDDQGKQYRDLLEAGQERELRLTDKLDDIAWAINGRIDEILKTPRK